MLTTLSVSAKKYPWKGLDHQYEVKYLKTNGRTTDVVKVYAVAGSPDKAIDQAIQDLAACVIFVGYQKMGTPAIPMWKNEAQSAEEFYAKNQAYLDEFFKSGEYFNYITNINKTYPSGENNIAVEGGRRVGVNLQIDFAALREKLEKDGIIRQY